MPGGGRTVVLLETSICDEAAFEAVRRSSGRKWYFIWPRKWMCERALSCGPTMPQQNVVGIVNMLEAARAANTGDLFSPRPAGRSTVSRNTSRQMRTSDYAECPYGVSKRAGELYLEYFSRKSQLSCYALRFGNVYGPRQNPFGEAGVVAIFSPTASLPARSCASTATAVRPGISSMSRCGAGLPHRGAGRAGKGFRIYNVGRGVESRLMTSLPAAGGMASARAAGGRRRSSRTRPGAPGRAAAERNRCAQAGTELGWKPEVALTEGLLPHAQVISSAGPNGRLVSGSERTLPGIFRSSRTSTTASRPLPTDPRADGCCIRPRESDQMLDDMEVERERGITIKVPLSVPALPGARTAKYTRST